MIIDCCRDNVGTLKSCALVCRGWHPRSRYRLFHAIRISSRRRLSELMDLIQELPFICHAVHFVAISPDEQELSATSFFSLALVVLLPVFPNLTKWRFSRGVLAASNIDTLTDTVWFHPTAFASLREFKLVRSLDLGPFTISAYPEFARLLRSLQQLEALRCEGIRVSNTSLRQLTQLRVSGSLNLVELIVCTQLQ